MRAPAPLRLSDLLVALSAEADLAFGQPPGESACTCLLATGLARRMGESDPRVADVFWTSLLMHVGCTAIAHDQAAALGGDEHAVNALAMRREVTTMRQAIGFVLELARSRPATERARVLLSALARGPGFGNEIARATCEVAAGMARRVGLSAGVERGIEQSFERWDGAGEPRGLEGEGISPASRYANLAALAMTFHRIGGVEAAVGIVGERSGGALDPALADGFREHAAELFDVLGACDPWEAALEAEPIPHRTVAEEGIDELAAAFADVVDLKTPFMAGHSRGVAELAEAAGRELGLEASDRTALRRAGLLHDLGRVAVPNGIWEKPGPLTAGEWEQVRLHAYHGERILARSPALADLAPLAGMHHERLDGSGYHRQAAGGVIPLPARVLGAADAYRAMTEARAHRPALAPPEAADLLHREAAEGRLDPRAVDAVLAVAGQDRPPARREWPAGLTDREVEVLGLLARGLRNRQIARRLHISPKTVGTHIEHIYEKAGVSTRASATMFAARHELLV